MAKHIVKCPICNKQFDANAEPYVMINARRYAHQSCAESAEQKKTKEEKDKEQLEKYIKELFGINCISAKIRKQIKTFREENNYSYSAIYKTLKYFFEVKKNPIEKANGGIGIVPYAIDQARDYWLDIMEARELNKKLTIRQVEIPAVEVRINLPKKMPIRRFREQFSFLEEGSSE